MRRFFPQREQLEQKEPPRGQDKIQKHLDRITDAQAIIAELKEEVRQTQIELVQTKADLHERTIDLNKEKEVRVKLRTERGQAKEEVLALRGQLATGLGRAMEARAAETQLTQAVVDVFLSAMPRGLDRLTKAQVAGLHQVFGQMEEQMTRDPTLLKGRGQVEQTENLALSQTLRSRRPSLERTEEITAQKLRKMLRSNTPVTELRPPGLPDRMPSGAGHSR